MAYDDNNIFAKILRGEIPCNKIYEDEFVLSFYDINLDDFNLNASDQEIVGLMRGITHVSKKLGISSQEGKGYRALANIGEFGGQEVPHLHFHLFGGEIVGKMVS